MVSRMDFDTELIREIRRNELIYNSLCKDYRHPIRKEKAWTEIARKLNADKNNCKKRWKNLRDTYKKSFRNGMKSSWKYSEDMAFLENFIYSKRHPVLRKSVRQTGEEDQEEDDTEQDMKEDADQDEQAEQYEDLEQEEDEEALFEENFAYEPSSASARPAKSSNGVAAVNTSYKKFGSQSSAQPQQGKNSTDLLFESLAKKLKESNLLDSEVSAIECKVMALVYSEIDKVRRGADMSLLEQLEK